MRMPPDEVTLRQDQSAELTSSVLLFSGRIRLRVSVDHIEDHREHHAEPERFP
jgi:hypothetical protein